MSRRSVSCLFYLELGNTIAWLYISYLDIRAECDLGWRWLKCGGQ